MLCICICIHSILKSDNKISCKLASVLRYRLNGTGILFSEKGANEQVARIRCKTASKVKSKDANIRPPLNKSKK